MSAAQVQGASCRGLHIANPISRHGRRTVLLPVHDSRGTPGQHRNMRLVVFCSKEQGPAQVPKRKAAGKVEQEEGYEEMSWLEEKVEDVKEATVAMVGAIPGPKVGSTAMPWLLAVPLGYFGLTFIIAVVKTVQRINSPKAKRQKQVNKNAGLVETLDKVLDDPAAVALLTPTEYSGLERKFGFGGAEVLRKYVRYALNEKPFTPDLVASLIALRRASQLADEEMAELLNDISRRTVKQKGPVVMDTSGFTERGLQRKVAVQALFSKLLYLSELEDFCSQRVRDKLEVKTIFGVTDEDADKIRIESLSSSDDLERLDKMLGGSIEKDNLEADEK